ncbi:MAG: tail fiber domain-containing protein [Polyangiaceae bacterium]
MTRRFGWLALFLILTLSGARDARAQSCGSNLSNACLTGTNLTSGSTEYGVFGSATNGAGVKAQDTSAGIGIIANSSSGIGVLGLANEGTFGTPSGTYAGYFAAPGAAPYAALYGNATASTAGVGVQGSGSGYGVYGTSTSGTGVYGSAGSGHNATSGVNTGSGWGVYAYSASGEALHAECSNGWGALNGINDSSGDGVYGFSTGGKGIEGACSGSGCYAGYFNGNAYVTGSLTVGSCSGCSSDSRLKKNVKPLEGALDQLLKLRGVTFEWINPDEHEGDAATQRGFIAQEVEKTFPNWVRNGGYTAPDGRKYKTLELRQIEALEVESIRELKGENDALRKELQATRARTTRLEERLDTLTNGRDPITGGVGFGRGALCLLAVAVAGAFGVARRGRQQSRS